MRKTVIQTLHERVSPGVTGSSLTFDQKLPTFVLECEEKCIFRVYLFIVDLSMCHITTEI